MRTAATVACLLLAAGIMMADPGHAKPDYARMRRHAQRLSESCKRKGRTLDDACITDPETTGGPYVWDQAPIRKNMTEGWEGVPFVLNITVVDSTTCTEIEGAAIEIWHCTPDGLYSHFIEASAGNGTDTDNTTFLRAIQYTDENGVASFESIWPGWYLPRATHVHVRVHFNITETDDGYSGGTIAHVGQLFFNDDIVEELATVYPYTTNTDSRTNLADDQVVAEQGGYYGLTNVTEMYSGQGYAAGVIGTVTVGVDNTETSTSSSSSSTPAPSTPSPTTPSPASTSTPSPATPTPSSSTTTPSPSTSAPATTSPATDSGSAVLPTLLAVVSVAACLL